MSGWAAPVPARVADIFVDYVGCLSNPVEAASGKTEAREVLYPEANTSSTNGSVLKSVASRFAERLSLLPSTSPVDTRA